MDVKEGTTILFCPYCGEAEMMIESEGVAKAKIRYEAFTEVEKHKHVVDKEVELERIKQEEKRENRETRKNEIDAFSDSKLHKWIIAFTVICVLATVVSLRNRNYLHALIAVVQAVLFLVSWLIGMGIINTNRRYLYRLFALAGFILIIPFFQNVGVVSIRTNRTPDLEQLTWPTTGLATILPTPESQYGKIYINDDDSFWAAISQYSNDQYAAYLEECKRIGFVTDSETTSNGYGAFNEEGSELSLYCYDGKMSIHLDAPMEMKQITWPDSGPAKLLSKPESTKGKIYTETSEEFSVYIGDMAIDQFEAYVSQCKKQGFTEDYAKTDKYYEAHNRKGYSLSVEYKGFNRVLITVEAPKKKQ